RIDLLRVLRAELGAGEIPLVEQDQRLPPRLPARDHAATIPSSASVDVEYSPLRNSSLRSTASERSRVVGTPSTTVSSSARSARAIAAERSAPQTTIFASSES